MSTKCNPAATNETSQKAKRGLEAGGVGSLFAFCDVLLVAAGLNLVNIGQLALLSAKAGEVWVPRRRPQPRSKKYVFGTKISKNHVFKPWGRQNRIPDFKIMNKSLLKFQKDLLGGEIKSLGTPEPLPNPGVPYFNGHTVIRL